MQTNLAEKSCTPCRGGIPPLTPEEAEAYPPAGPGVEPARRRGAGIERTYRFRNFRDAFGFVETAAAPWPRPKGIIPDISFGWGDVTVSLRTKKIKGLHENDFIMAAKLDRLAGAPATAG